VLAAGSEKQSGVTIVNFRYTNLLQTSNSLHITIVKISTMNSSKPFFYKLWLGVSLINGTILVAWFAGYDVLAPLRRKLRRQARQCNWRPVAPKTTTSKPTLGGRNAGIFSSPDHIGWINDDLPVQRRDQQAPEEGKKGKTGPRAPESVWKFSRIVACWVRHVSPASTCSTPDRLSSYHGRRRGCALGRRRGGWRERTKKRMRAHRATLANPQKGDKQVSLWR